MKLENICLRRLKCQLLLEKENVEKAEGSKIDLITVDENFSDIEKFMFKPIVSQQ